MCSDLKYAVCRSIYDQLAGAYVFIPIIRNDLGAGIRFITQNISSGAKPELFQNLLRETVGIRRKRLWRIDTGNLPVSYGRILSSRTFRHTGISRCGMFGFLSHSHTIDLK